MPAPLLLVPAPLLLLPLLFSPLSTAGDGLALSLGDSLGVALGVLEGDAPKDREAVGVVEVEAVSDSEADTEGLSLCDAVAVSEGVLLALGVLDAVAPMDSDWVGVEVLDGVGAAVEVEVVEGRMEGEGDTLGLPEAVLVLLRLDPLEGVRCTVIGNSTARREWGRGERRLWCALNTVDCELTRKSSR